MSDGPFVTANEDGELVLVDPTAAAVIEAVNQSNCRLMIDLNRERIAHFAERAAGRDVAIVLINADDTFGTVLTDTLMPGFDRKHYRDQGMIPVARGIVPREPLMETVRLLNPAAADMMLEPNELFVVVFDCGTAAVFNVREI